MATYNELYTLLDAALASPPSDLFKRTVVAVAVQLDTIRTESPATPNHDQRAAWAERAIVDPEKAAKQVFWILLGQNKDLTLTQINGATDVALQNAVEAALDILAP